MLKNKKSHLQGVLAGGSDLNVKVGQKRLTINRKYSKERVDCAVKITSNHLHPVYMKGDVLLISKRAPRDGDIGIFILKETRQLFIREIRQTNPCELRPINGL